MFRIALEQSYSNTRLQYMWTMYAPNGVVVCFSNLYDLPAEALHNAELITAHFNMPSSTCELDANSVEKITGMVPSAPHREVKRAFTLIKNEDPK
jgi:uncharacterized protein YegP (UPF0339 family)